MSPHSNLDWIAIRKHLETLVQKAGKMQLAALHSGASTLTKSSEVDLVTATDRAIEEMLVQEIMDHYPSHHIIGEEFGTSGNDAAQAAYYWYIDPIDGTTNFAHGIPFFCVSIALTDTDNNPLMAFIHNPNLNETFVAIQNQGAWLNGQPIHVSQTEILGAAVVASGFAYDKHTNPDNNTVEWTRFVTRTRGMRRLGSAALDLAYVAAGRFDAYWERGVNNWDVLAGILLIQEAGGQITDYQGKTIHCLAEDRRIVASNGLIHEAVLALLKPTP
ncbi:inositol monophosphatase family protein [Anaerolineales bacterium]